MGQPYVPAGYDEFTFTHDGRSHRVFRAGTGPAVVVLHEMLLRAQLGPRVT